MLIVHPASTCDVCLDPFSWAHATTTPHAIACGHVFCLRCLMCTNPSLCPLCRKAFLPERIKKLHIDPPASDEHAEADESIQVNGFLQRIALVSGEDTPEENVMDVVSEVNRWLSGRNRAVGLYRPLRYAVAALHRNTTERQENRSMRDALQKQGEEMKKYVHVREEDSRMSRTVEESLTNHIRLLEEKLDLAERSLQSAEAQLEHIRSESTASRTGFPNGYAQSIGYPVPSQSSRTDAYPASYRPSTSMSLHSHHSSSSRLTRSDVASMSVMRVASEPLMDMSNPSAVEEEPTQIRASNRRKSVIVPGAPPSKRVIPPLSSSGSSYSPLQSPVIPARDHDLFYSSEDAARSVRSEVNSQVGAAPTISAPQYGYVPGVGYVPVPNLHPSTASVRSSEAGTVGQLMLYSQEHQPASTLDITVPHTVEAAARALAVSSGEIGTAESTWGHLRNVVPMNTTVSSSSVATVATTDRPADASHSALASNSASNLALSGTLSTSERQITQPAVRARDPSPEPSIASTWGTVPSVRTSRSTSVRDLQLTGLPAAMADLDLSTGPSTRNSSFADLRLTRLPDPSTDNASLVGTSSSSDRVDAIPVTPRALAWYPVIPPHEQSTTHSVPILSHLDDDNRSHGDNRDLDVLTPRMHRPSVEPASLGLVLSTSSNPSRQHISGLEDLQHLNRSLLQAASEPHGSSRRHRYSRAISMSGVEDHTASEFGVRDSHASNISIDSVQLDNERAIASTHRPDGARADRRLTSGGNPLAAHTDRISGPVAVPSASQPSESHADRNRQRRRSSISAAALVATPGSSNDVADMRHRHSRVTRDSGTDHAPFSHMPPQSRPASIYSSHRNHSFGSSVASTSSLGLSLMPAGPGASAATTASGEPSSIRAPRPVNGSHSGNVFAMWS